MNIVEQVQARLKEEIRAAVVKAGLATEEQIPNVVLELPKEKHMEIIQQIWRCN